MKRHDISRHKARLSEVLCVVDEGRSVVIADRDFQVAILFPILPASLEDHEWIAVQNRQASSCRPEKRGMLSDSGTAQ